MRLLIEGNDPLQIETDVLVLAFFKGDESPKGCFDNINKTVVLKK